MLAKKTFVKLTTAIVVAGSGFGLALPVFAQSYFWPSASFFLPRASNFESEDSEEFSLIEMLEQSEDYKTFNSSLQKANLTETIEQKSLTVLVPTNEAFAALSPQLKTKLSDPENLKKVLQYHLIVGSIGEEDIQRQGVATLLKQNSVEITGYPISDKEVGVKLNDAIASGSLPASDGVIIPIDRVLIPPTLR